MPEDPVLVTALRTTSTWTMRVAWRGMGLGLYISKCIVQGHGGRIRVESEMGAGSTSVTERRARARRRGRS